MNQDRGLGGVAERWLLARPRGGLNDTLCQIEKCWRFAEKTGRQLVFDTGDSGLLLDFHEVFAVRNERNRVIPHRLTEDVIAELNKLSTFPADVQGNVTGYDKFKDEHDEFHTLPSRSPLKFSLKKDYSEDVVVYEGMGGGVDSFCALERLKLTPWIVNAILEASQRLPQRYISIHVRHSDMRTDYQRLFGYVRRRNTENLAVFLASDSDAVIQHAKVTFGENTLFTLPSKIPRPGDPLHDPAPNEPDSARRDRTSEALSELFALSSSETFFFTEVDSRGGVSGFSRLAAHLGKTPPLRKTLLGSPPHDLRNRKARPVHVAPFHRQLIERARWQRSRCV